MPIRTAVTELLAIRHPILLAPMAGVSGGALAAAVTHAGGLGLIGGGYGDRTWLDREFAAAGNARVGVGFITWKLSEQPALLDAALDRAPAAIFLSFGDFAHFAGKIARSSSHLIAQVQTVKQAKRALDAGAGILVAQGTEAGGHGGKRATLPLVPAVVDIAGKTPVLAAGGIADGRGLAAALMLGAGGVLCGTAFFAASEALSHPEAKVRAISASGDMTVRSSVFDIARGYDWPANWDLRTLRNAYLDEKAAAPERFHAEGDAARLTYAAAVERGDFDTAAVIVGEAVGMVERSEPAAGIVRRLATDAERLLAGSQRFLQTAVDESAGTEKRGAADSRAAT